MNEADARRRAIKAAIKEYTSANTTSASTARAALVKEGIVTKSGELKSEFGGRTKKDKSAA